jgi:hypothetical protein
MFPVPSYAAQLELEWASELAAHLGVPEDDFRANPTGHLDYPSDGVRVELMDGSFVEFRYAFALVNESRKCIAVFSEHCGHHIFPYHEARILAEGRVTYDQRAA